MPVHRSLLDKLRVAAGYEIPPLPVVDGQDPRPPVHGLAKVKRDQCEELMESWNHLHTALGLNPQLPPCFGGYKDLHDAVDWLYDCHNVDCARRILATPNCEDKRPSLRCSRCYALFCDTVRAAHVFTR